MIARKDDHPRGQYRMLIHRVHEFRPFGRAAGIGHITGDKDYIERPDVMDCLDACHDLREAAVAPWPAAPAFYPKSILLSDQVNV